MGPIRTLDHHAVLLGCQATAPGACLIKQLLFDAAYIYIYIYIHIYIYIYGTALPAPPPPPPMVMGQTSTPPPCGCGPVVGLWWFRVGLELV